jgi:hypothetical protein
MAHGEHQVSRRTTLKDPLDYFPAEIQLLILNYLPTHDVMRSRRVSRRWNRQLASPEFAVLYRHLDLVRGNSNANTQSKYIKACVKYSRGGLKRAILDVPKSSPVLSDAFNTIVRSSRKLETLVLLNIGFPVQGVAPLLQQLTALVLSATINVSCEELKQILASGVNLVELDIRAISITVGEVAWKWNTNCRKLQRLRLALKEEQPGKIILSHEHAKVSSIYASEIEILILYSRDVTKDM